MDKPFAVLSEAEQKSLLDKVYEIAKEYEGEYGCCPQCVLGAMHEVFKIGDKMVFKAAYGFGAGTGLTSECGCGALVGAILFIGMRCGRTYEAFAEGKAEKCYTLSRHVVEYFTQKYGGPLCKNVQTAIMGRSFNLNIPEESQAFIDAGGHTDKCTNVCGDVCRLLGELLIQGEL